MTVIYFLSYPYLNKELTVQLLLKSQYFSVSNCLVDVLV